MKKIIRDVDEKRGIVQATFADERWYFKPSKVDSVPKMIAVPSVTFIAHSYPKGIGYYKWLADKGWDEAEGVKNAAANKGSKVHQAVDAILNGNEVRIDSKFINHETEKEEELTLEECDAILSFVRWRNEHPDLEIVANESVLFSEKFGYAGTIDLICKIEDRYWLIDFKTSQQVWPEHILQVSAYKAIIANGENEFDGLAIEDAEDMGLAILQLGYRKNRDGYKWNEVAEKFDLFLAARQIWEYEHGTERPKVVDYPIILSPAATMEEILK